MLLQDAQRRDSALRQAVEALQAGKGQCLIYGVTGSQKSAVLAAGFSKSQGPLVILVTGREQAEIYRNDFATLLPGVPVLEQPVLDIVTFTAAAKSVELAARRMTVLGKLLRRERVVVLATVEAAVQPVVPPDDFLNNRITLELGAAFQRDDLLAALVRFGYERVDQVDGMGQFSARGGIVDIFPVNRPFPLRVEFFDAEVDSLREFDPDTQRSLENIDQVDVLPVTEPEHSSRWVSFLSYVPEGAPVILDEPSRLKEESLRLIKENPEIRRRLLPWQEVVASAGHGKVVYVSLLLKKPPYGEPEEIIGLTAKAVVSFHKQMEMLMDELRSWLQKDYSVVIYVHGSEKAEGLRLKLQEEGIAAGVNGEQSVAGLVMIADGYLHAGFEMPEGRLAVLAEQDIFGRQKKRRPPRAAKEGQIQYFRDINVGDYVVHVHHGIGKYAGVETLEVGGVHRDYLHIRYAGDDKLFVPTDQVHLLQKYLGAEGMVPRLSKLGGSDWVKTKAKAKASVADLAKDLIRLYAERQLEPGIAFEKDTTWQNEFEDAFPFEETPDQLSALAEIKKDMEEPRPMDRLLCGDVGFGKTEVAVRAAFKAVMGKKQVAVLVPTTVLAQQHYQTFSARFAEFGPTVEVVSRFRSAREQKEILRKVAAGKVDVLIGTHRILQPDVLFQDLGLLIVDEEQRFGVAQKEKLKKWRTNVDVLTLSATPIPRTLHMSLVGARDMSIIETPPEDRFPVQTYVVEYHEEIIRDALRRELKRGGQVYFVYNRVQDIDKMHRQLTEMLPDARIKVAHGQMAEELLEAVMLEFYEGKHDILLCTSIIENGLDVANANTIIVYDADRFGLSQLYQMRGRVGRSHRLAFAYFTYRRDKVLSEIAEKRLQAIKDFAELGAGFKIAMRDMEIRGVGNLLGSEQHGHIISVGFEMYCRLLEEAVQELRQGRPAEIVPEPLLEMDVEAYLSGEYIHDAMHKMELYQRIAAVREENHLTELLDEMIDRFGDPPKEVENLLGVARLKNRARNIGIRSLIQRGHQVEITFLDNPDIQVERVMELKQKMGSRMTMLPGPPEIIRINTQRWPELLPGLDKALAVLEKEKDAAS